MKTLEQMAEEAGMVRYGILFYAGPWDLKRFAALVAERCAEMVKATAAADPDTRFNDTEHWLGKAAEAILVEFPKP